MSLPKDLTDKKQWVCWRAVPDKNNGKEKKIPFNPNTGKTAASNKPHTWSDYTTAVESMERYGYTGVGFMFVKEDGIVGVDIDNCYDKDTGAFNETAQAIISKQPTYAEFSPSGTGVHLFYKGDMPSGGNKNTATGVEMYDSMRYFTMTGKKLETAPDTISEDDGTLIWIHEKFIRPSRKIYKKKSTVPITLSDEELLDKATKSDDGDSFTMLWEGKWQDSFPSQSEADMSLCRKLAFWSGKDREQMDRLFRQSKLYREKWDVKHHASGATYGEETIARAMEMTETVYNPGGDNPVFEYKGRYFRSRGDNVYPITNFIVQPVEMIVSNDETQVTANLITIHGESYRQTFMTTDFTNLQRFKNILNKHTIALSYLGSESDLELLKGYLYELEWKIKTGVKALGIYDHSGQMVFVSTEGAIGTNVKSVDDIVQLEKYRSIDSDIMTQSCIDKNDIIKLGAWLMTYNEPAKTVSILAWCAGCFIKPHLHLKKIKFPHLFLIGEAGSGKSNTLEKVILPMFSRTRVTAAGQVTAFTLMKDSASSNMIPQPFDEFKPSKIDRLKLNSLYNHFRDVYDGHEGLRGRADQTTISYELLAPMIVAGEESPDEAAIRERSIELLFTKKDLKNCEYRTIFNNISNNSNMLSRFGRALLEMALNTKPSDVQKWYDYSLGIFSKELPTRVISNLACCCTGVYLLEKLCISYGLMWSEIFPISKEDCHKYLEYAAKEYLLDGKTTNQSVVEQTFEIMARMNLVPRVDYIFDKDGTILYIWLTHVYDQYTKYRRDYAITGEVLTYAQFKKQLRYSDFLIASNEPKRIGGELRKVWAIDFNTLKERCDVSGFDNTGVEPI